MDMINISLKYVSIGFAWATVFLWVLAIFTSRTNDEFVTFLSFGWATCIISVITYTIYKARTQRVK